jgi:ATP-dependent Clp endopeptidase proteolytic subunit ClpP
MVFLVGLADVFENDLGGDVAAQVVQVRIVRRQARVRGQAADIAIQAEQLGYTKRRMAELTAHHTGQTLEKIQADAERDRWFTASEAVEYGLVDRVINKRGEIA